VIRRATPADAERACTLLLEYADGTGLDLSFQGFDDELADPIGTYEAFFFSEDGCVAVRRIDDQLCELKRLYVRETARGSGIGRRLAVIAIAEARSRGFVRMRLDTLPTMHAARALYASLGFREIEAYRFNPVHGTTYFELEL
jgi:ribosomal protein S18 acetylase RimI-like enzyme